MKRNIFHFKISILHSSSTNTTTSTLNQVSLAYNIFSLEQQQHKNDRDPFPKYWQSSSVYYLHYFQVMFLISAHMTVWLDVNNGALQFVTNVKAECTHVWSKSITYNFTLPCMSITILANGFLGSNSCEICLCSNFSSHLFVNLFRTRSPYGQLLRLFNLC